MKFSLIIDTNREEELVLYTRERDKFAEEIENMCKSRHCEVIGYKDKDAVVLEIADIYCFIAEDNKIFAITENEKLQVKQRIYMLEELLPDSFIKINQSCIANIKKIERFNASIGGSLMVKFKNGYTDYISRRNLKSVKERMGL